MGIIEMAKRHSEELENKKRKQAEAIETADRERFNRYYEHFENYLRNIHVAKALEEDGFIYERVDNENKRFLHLKLYHPNIKSLNSDGLHIRISHNGVIFGDSNVSNIKKEDFLEIMFKTFRLGEVK